MMCHTTVIPAKAGIACGSGAAPSPEIPAFAGMTGDGSVAA